MKKLVLMVAMVIVLGMWSSGAIAVGYHASLNTLPTDQDWTPNFDYSDTDVYVSSGILYQTSGEGGYSYATRYATTNLDFTSSDLFVIQGELKVITSSSWTDFSSMWRTGYEFVAFDDNLREVYLGIAGDKVRLSNGVDYLRDTDSTPWITFDTTSAFNTYRIEVAGGNMSLFINGVSKATLAVGSAPGHLAPNDYKNQFRFGDGTWHAGSQTELKYVTFGGNGTPVPEPASMLLFSLGLLGLAGVRRKLKK